jgi:hypothetical protein
MNYIKSKKSMKTKHYLIISILALIVILACVGLYMYFMPQKDYSKAKPDIIVTSDDFFKDFSDNEKNATEKYVTGNKTILITGAIKEIKKREDGIYMISLGGVDSSVSIRCSLRIDQTKIAEKLKQGDKIAIKGQCAGYEELIDKEVIMIGCAISKPD